MAVDLDLVRHALTVARKGNYATVELETGDLKFSAELGKAPKKRPSAAPGEANAPESPAVKVVKAPMVGYFSFSDAKIEPETEIAAEDVVGTITVLGIPTEVVAGVNGILEAYMAEDGAAVEYGQPLATVRPE